MKISEEFVNKYAPTQTNTNKLNRQSIALPTSNPVFKTEEQRQNDIQEFRATNTPTSIRTYRTKESIQKDIDTVNFELNKIASKNNATVNAKRKALTEQKKKLQAEYEASTGTKEFEDAINQGIVDTSRGITGALASVGAGIAQAPADLVKGAYDIARIPFGNNEDTVIDKAYETMSGYTKNILNNAEGNEVVNNLAYTAGNLIPTMVTGAGLKLATKGAEIGTKLANSISKVKGLEKASKRVGNIAEKGITSGVSSIPFIAQGEAIYREDGKARGLEGADLDRYAITMASIEGLTEMIPFNRALKGISKAKSNKVIDSIKNIGIGASENAIQEAIIEPINESVAKMYGGAYDFTNIGQRMLESGLEGATVYLILGGIGARSMHAVNAGVKAVKGEEITEEDIKAVEQDLKNKGVDVEAVKEKYNEIVKGEVENNTKPQRIESNTTPQVETSITAPKTDLIEGRQQVIRPQRISEIRNNIEQAPIENGMQVSYSIKEDTPSVRAGVLEMREKGYNIPTETVETLDKISANRGIKYKFAELPKGINGQYDRSTREYIINVNTKEAVEFVTLHELTHDLEGTKEYSELQKFVIDYASKQKGYEQAVNSLKQAYINLYKKQNRTFGEAELNAEITADIVARALGNKKFLEQLARKQRSLIEKILEIIDKIIANIRGKGKEYKYLQELKERYTKAYEQNFNSKNSTQSSFSLSENATDNQGRQLSKQQQEYFKDSKVRDDNGNLLTVYHASKNDFNTFDKSKIRTGITIYANNGDGFYFTDSKSLADEYSKGNGKVYETYLDITNPLVVENNISDEANKVLTEFSKKMYEKHKTEIEKETFGKYTVFDAKNDIGQRSGGAILSKVVRNYGDEFTKFLKTKGYDGIKTSVTDYFNTGAKFDYIVFEPNQIKNVDNTKPTSNEDIRYSKDDVEGKVANILSRSQTRADGKWKEFTETLPAQKGEKTYIEKETKASNNTYINEPQLEPLRKTNKVKLQEIIDMKPEDMAITESKYKAKDKKEGKQRLFYENVGSSKILINEVKNLLEPTNIKVKKNLDTLSKMNDKLNKMPRDTVLNWISKDSKEFTDEDVALGVLILDRYQKSGDTGSAVSVIDKLAEAGTEKGRALQMYSIFQRLTPKGMMVYQQRKLNRIFKDVTKKETKEWINKHKNNYILNEEDIEYITAKVQEAQNVPTEREKIIALAQIEARINDKIPPEQGQSALALRRISMLLNPKTQIRNLVGNAGLTPAVVVSDYVATAIDKIIAKKTGVRTTDLPQYKTFFKGYGKGAKETIEDYKLGINTQYIGNKYEFKQNGNSFNTITKKGLKKAINRGLNSTEKILNTVMQLGDRPFYQAYYENSLAGQMKANNVKVPTQAMKEIAENEAMERTWQDNNGYTKSVLTLRSVMNRIHFKGFGLGDLVIPFAKTPANLTKAMVEYSPVGLLKALLLDLKEVRLAIDRGDLTAQQQKKFVSNFSKGVTGTLLYVIASALAGSGAITGSADEDEDVRNFEQNVMGIQPYSVRIGDTTFTYNWLMPLGTPFAVMADTYKLSKEKADILEQLQNVGNVAFDQLISNSFLQGVKELFDTKYGGNIFSNLISAAEELPIQFIPTFASQLAMLQDSSKKQTYEKGDEFQTLINKAIGKLPFFKGELANQVNTYGKELRYYNEDENAGDTIVRGLNIFLNPSNVSTSKATEEQKELYALYEATKDKTIFPKQAPYSVGNRNLTSQEREQYQKVSGEYVTKALNGLMNSSNYKKLNNDQKVEILSKVVDDANNVAKNDYVSTESSKKINDIYDKLILNKIPLVDYYNAMYAKNKAEGQKDSKGNTIKGTKKKAQIEAIQKATNLSSKKEEILYKIFSIEK